MEAKEHSMKKRLLDALDNALVGLLLASSYLGFFFIVIFCIFLTGVKLTILITVLVFLCSCGLTHLLLRLICGVQSKANIIRWKEKNRRKEPVEE